jgi:pilus assembly protein Flp/PilA
MTMRAILLRWVRDESGATAVEYGMIVALVSIAAIIALQALGQSVVEMYERIGATLDRINARLR